MSRNQLAQSLVMSDEGARIAERRERLRLTKIDLAKESGVHRDTLSDIEAGKGFQAATLGKIEETLTRLETEAGLGAPPRPQGFIRFSVEGVYGAKALVVETPVENVAELEEMVDRILRRLQGDAGGAPPSITP